ncbi:MAG: DUF5060 domain-containing protein [Thermogutta sp.]
MCGIWQNVGSAMVWCLIMNTALVAGAQAAEIEQWGVAELTFQGPGDGNPYVEVRLSARFSQGDRSIEVPGFWDGGSVYKLRFSPPTQGVWLYETRSNRPALDGKTGSLKVGPPSPDNHGPIEVFNTYYLRHADGTPYHQFGTTCYAWIHQPEELQQQTLETLASSPFNKIRFCIFPKSYAYNQNEPDKFAFVRSADGTFDFSRPDPKFWLHLESRILDLQRLGIEADLILWHPYDRWGFSKMGAEQDDRYLWYCIARLSAFRNVWWSLANEYDFMKDKKLEDWDRFFSILQKEDPHQRFRGIHNGRVWYDHTKAWVTHASLQSSDMNGGVRFREQYRKPVIYDECRYEGNIPQGWGNLSPQEMVQRFWLGTLSGCYVGHGETYQHPQDILWWSKGGVLHGQSPQRIQWLKDLMAQAPPFHELRPLGDDKGRFVLAKPGEYYLVYCLRREPQTIELAGTQPYKVDLIDPWNMTIVPAGTAQPGVCTLAAPASDMAFRLTPYAPEEALRPELRIEPARVEGLVPLEAVFRATGSGGEVEWDLGDGAKAVGVEARHTYQKPGVYLIKATLRDALGNLAAAAYARVVADRISDEPIARIAFPAGETPSVHINGSAKRGSEGELIFSDAAPWGWVRVGDAPLEELRGLRSFTISGWLRPTSLTVGSGGNRIVHCMKTDGDGIDLVCLADGRLRLSVNQWPDGVRNDSSPGKLVVGKWTYFAVTYDAEAEGESVAWYFSEPQERPGKVEITLDRKTGYRNGPVGTEADELVIGNFNRTMQSHGLDRQFRGAIRGLQIFGSRVTGRGAQDLETIRKNMP